MKINDFWGDVTDISAEKEILLTMRGIVCTAPRGLHDGLADIMW